MNSNIKILFLAVFTIMCAACGEEYLDEVPLDQFSPENLLVDEAGFNTAVTAIYQAARKEHNIASSIFEYMNVGTDMARWGRADNRGLSDYTLLNSSYQATSVYWDWAYEDMIVRTNLVLDGIDDPLIDLSDEARASFKGQALFFRAYTYNFLANIYGDVPIVDSRLIEPKFDFKRSSRLEVLQFAADDLEMAVELLPLQVEEDGRIPRAAALHLLSEVYISLGMESDDASFYDLSIEAASKVINKEAGDYELMTARFGAASSEPGDVYSDLFVDGQVNYSEGNKEVLWSWQYELFILGGDGNQSPRYWGCEYDKILTPNNVLNIPDNEYVRGIGVNSPTDYMKHYIWRLDNTDIRNSEYNIRRTFYYNNPADEEYYLKEIKTAYGTDGNLYIAEDDGTITTRKLDTIRQYYPWFRKINGPARAESPSSGSTAKDFSRMRVAETYLLRAEAYFRKGDLASSASDINVIRTRANASLISAGDVTEDFILDERARELYVEEARLRTLIRMGRLVDRVRTYNSDPYAPDGPSAGTTIADHNEYWPIPQSVIDANSGAEMTQNPGY